MKRTSLNLLSVLLLSGLSGGVAFAPAAGAESDHSVPAGSWRAGLVPSVEQALPQAACKGPQAACKRFVATDDSKDEKLGCAALSGWSSSEFLSRGQFSQTLVGGPGRRDTLLSMHVRLNL